jgi:hypothetical protein
VGARRKSRAERCFSGRPNEGSIQSNNLGSNPPLSKQMRISEIDSIFDMLRLVPGLATIDMKINLKMLSRSQPSDRGDRSGYTFCTKTAKTWRGLMLERVKRNFNRQVYAEVLLQAEVNL